MVIHVVTGLVVVRPGLPWWRALLWTRSVHHRVMVGGQWAPKIDEEPWRLCTTVLLHVDALHLLLNASALFALGQMLEHRVGRLRFTAWAAIGGFVGALCTHLVGIRQSDGASGAAFALLGAGLTLGLRTRRTLSPDDRFLLGPMLAGFLVLNLVLSMFMPSINMVAHLGGLATGLLLGALPDHIVIRSVEAVLLGLFIGACSFAIY